MSHEMLRYEADQAGFETEGLPVAIVGPDRDHDVVNVWDQLPDADSIEPELVEYGTEPPPDTTDTFTNIDTPDPITEGEASDR